MILNKIHISFEEYIVPGPAVQLNKSEVSWEIAIVGLIVYNSIGKYGDENKSSSKVSLC